MLPQISQHPDEMDPGSFLNTDFLTKIFLGKWEMTPCSSTKIPRRSVLLITSFKKRMQIALAVCFLNAVYSQNCQIKEVLKQFQKIKETIITLQILISPLD